jgi:hypothetical protein
MLIKSNSTSKVQLNIMKSLSIFETQSEISSFFHFIAFQFEFVDINCSLIYLLRGLNTDSGNYSLDFLWNESEWYSVVFFSLGKYAKPATFNGIERWPIDTETLFPEIVELRVFKTPEELNLLRYVNRISR